MPSSSPLERGHRVVRVREGRAGDAAGDVDVEPEAVAVRLLLALQHGQRRVRPSGLEEVDAHEDVGVGGEGAAVFRRRFFFF